LGGHETSVFAAPHLHVQLDALVAHDFALLGQRLT
jgi:hypothetical protein